MQFLLIGAGAVLGANARYLVSLWAAQRFGADFPYGTFIVNVTGSLLLGLLLGLSTERLITSPQMRFFVATGFLGSYTTFSTFAVESILLVREGNLLLAGVNVLSDLLIGLLCAAGGLYLARLVG